ncbi:restriction endonuclease [Nonomuraea typhae]|uniref:Restriction endonuclease n=1 Tax=Nonomuraea typhae TaxID=2603600 RepID=A0ABW7Z5N2_9ACTN
MDSYEISRLTDFDFEAVCKDLFERYLKIHLEIFAPGRDAGVDLRHCSPRSAKTVVVQCKRWDRNAESALYRHMRDKELPKITRLKPDRYILATSVSLTRGAKDKLARLLHPYVLDAGDIFGLHEVEGLLNAHPDVVQRHLRLWLSSTSVLQAVLNKSVVVRTSDLAQDITEAARIYVPNASFQRAHDVLEQSHYCIIAGLPGIGKTTLARVLSAAYAEAGYEIFEISEDAEEVNNVWLDNVPQLFYYDDFLGQTTLADKLHKNEDARLLRLFKRVAASPGKRLILTTREYILASARQHYERIASAESELLTCVVDLNDYTKLIRAEILYNHVYYSGLASEARTAFSKPAIYLPIIEHRNFSPRLVERSISKSVVDGEVGEWVAKSLLENMEHPSRLWQHIVDNQLDPDSVAILLLLFSLDGIAYIGDLEFALSSYVGHSLNGVELKRRLKFLESTMVRVLPGQAGGDSMRSAPRISYHNPSIRDYMRDYVGEDRGVVGRLVEKAVFFEQLISLWSAAQGWGGKLLLSSVRVHRDAFVAALIRTYPERPSIARGHMHGTIDIVTQEYIQRLVPNRVARLRLLVEVCEDLSDKRLIAFTAECLANADLSEEASDGSDLATLTKAIWKSPVPEIAQYGEEAVEEAVEWITADLWDWNNISSAEQALQDLDDLVSSEIHQEIEEAYDAAAMRWLETFEDLGQFDIGDLHTVQEIVDRLDRLLGSDERVARAQESILAAKEIGREHKLEAPKDAPEPAEDSTARIQQMLTSLRDL